MSAPVAYTYEKRKCLPPNQFSHGSLSLSHSTNLPPSPFSLYVCLGRSVFICLYVSSIFRICIHIQKRSKKSNPRYFTPLDFSTIYRIKSIGVKIFFNSKFGIRLYNLLLLQRDILSRNQISAKHLHTLSLHIMKQII